MRIPIAIYPYCSELLPLVKHFEQVQEKYCITRLISPPGLGLGGKDAAHARNHPNIGHVVMEEFDAEETSWDILFLTRVIQPAIIDDDTISKMVEKALLAGKKVIYFDNCLKNVPNPIWQFSEIYADKITIITEDIQPVKSKDRGEKYGILEVPVILVGGLIAVEDTFEILISLTECLKKQGFTPTVISRSCAGKMLGHRYHCLSHVINRRDISVAKTIESLNSYIRDLEKSEMPDIILMEAPDSIMRYNNIAPHGFGIYTYMLCQAAMPDYFICGIPVDLADGNFLAAISEKLTFRLGTAIDVVHLSNIIIDSADVLQTKKISYVHTSLNMVQNQLKLQGTHSDIPLFDIITNGADSLCSTLLSNNNEGR